MTYIDFRKKIATDNEFAAKFTECKTPEALVEAAAKEGYTFTVADINEQTELLPEELELAAGGWAIGGKNWFVTGHTIATKG